LALVLAHPSAGQEVPLGYDVGFHIVRQGETLRGITRAYLGSESLWEKNWGLNPQVEDPDLLFPLQRLRVLLAPRVARPTARLITISGQVEGKPAPADWNPSVEDDLMLERDGVRAGDNASTVLQFTDGSRLKVADESVVFLRVAGRTLRGVEQRSVEIVEGQADLAAGQLPEGTEIEVVVGGAVARPQVTPGGGIDTRARRSAEGGAQLMVYEGATDVEAGGAKVAVPKGMGTAVPESGPPAPPEKLLVAPAGLEPPSGADLEIGRDRFRWQPDPAAVTYTFELCSDPQCDQLLLRRAGLEGASFDASQVEIGRYFWRVTAVSASGLDGYPSVTRSVKVVPMVVDTRAPSGTLELDGASVTRAGTTYWGPALEVRLEVEDDATGVDSLAARVNGSDVALSRLTEPWASGEYEVEVTARDGAGNEAVIGPAVFAVDADPPGIEIESGGLELLGAGPDRRDRGLPRWVRRRLAAFAAGEGGPPWHVLRWSAVESPRLELFSPNLLARRTQPESLRITRGEVELLLFAPALKLPDETDTLGPRFVRLEASDERSGMTDLRIRQVGTSPREVVLEIDVVDRLDNRDVLRLDFVPPPAD
jgi:hypothetical protein